MSTENWGLLGHEWAVSLLQNHLEQDRLRHAYLFTGPRGVGRRSLALRFAQVLNNSGRYDPNSIPSQQFERMQHIDLSVVARQEGDRDIKIEAVRDLLRMLSLTPYMAEYRIALLLNFEEASDNAANALLKTLEEPANRVVLMLTAESAEGLLPTIVSRCEVIRLRPVPLEALAEGMQKEWQLSPEQAALISHIAGGRPGYARQLVQNPDLLTQRTNWLDDHHKLLSSNRVVRFAYAKKIKEDRGEVIQTLLVWLSLWRDVLLRASNSQAPLTNPDRAEEIQALANSLERPVIEGVTATLAKTLGELRTNVNTQLTVETVMLALPLSADHG